MANAGPRHEIFQWLALMIVRSSVDHLKWTTGHGPDVPFLPVTGWLHGQWHCTGRELCRGVTRAVGAALADGGSQALLDSVTITAASTGRNVRRRCPPGCDPPSQRDVRRSHPGPPECDRVQVRPVGGLSAASRQPAIAEDYRTPNPDPDGQLPQPAARPSQMR
jgi:hypothetical protein